LPFGVFQGGLRAAQKFVVLNVLRSIILIAGLIFIVLGFTFGLVGLVWVAGVQLLLAVGEGVGFYMLSRRIVPWQRVRWSSFNWRVLKKVSNFSLLSLVAGVAGLLYWQTHNVVINKLLEPSLLTGYAVVVSFILYTFQLTSLGTTVLGPVATVMHAKGDLPRMGRLIYRANRTVVPMSICILFFIIIFGREILRVYLGPGYESYAVLFPILGISAAISATQNSSAIVPRAFGRIFTVSLMSLVVAILNVLLGLYFVLVLKWGLIGVAAGTAIVTIFYKWVFWPWYTGRMLGISYMEYLQKSSLAPIFHSLPFIVVILVLRFMNFGKGWIGLISVFMIAGSIQAIYMLMHGLEKSDRIRVRELMVESLSLFKLVLKPKTNE